MLEVPAGQACRIDDFLASALPAELAAYCDSSLVSRTKIRRLLLKGMVQVAGRSEVIPGRRVRPGQTVLVRIDLQSFLHERQPDDTVFTAGPDSIIFEDEDLLVVNKPAGLPVDRTMKADRVNLYAEMRLYLEQRDTGTCNKTAGESPAAGSEPAATARFGQDAQDGQEGQYLALQHRLDRDTSGLVLFVKNPAVNKNVHDLFMQRRIHKTYLALCSPISKKIADNFEIINSLARISPSGSAAKWASVDAGGQSAHTAFQIKRRFSLGFLIQAQPFTGRTHQIRVHLSEAGLPIYGDTLYGGSARIATWSVPRCLLHAARLDFPHPRDGRKISLFAPNPVDFDEAIRKMQ
ncbi:MAG: RluA family pseudouridine synthase [Spirochaetes bacterium]|nr:RluA family pseudouridine synthase [Spirochaetota bacterium]